MSARDRILDTLESILIAEGDRGATLDAVAAQAGVSKGGLLYHFRNREAMVDGLLDRLEIVAAEDFASMENAPEGASSYYLRTSTTTGDAFDRLLTAITRLGVEKHPRAGETIRAIQHQWYQLLLAELKDPGIARAVMLMGDGLYYNALFANEWPSDPAVIDQLSEVLSLLQRTARLAHHPLD